MIRLLVCVAVSLVQQLPAPFDTPWFRKNIRVVALPDCRLQPAPVCC